MENHTKVAVVTGASSGIGRAAAIALNSAGWTVVLSGRRADALAETVQAMPADSRSKTLVVSGDLSSPDDVRNLFASVKTTYGEFELVVYISGDSRLLLTQ
jgi:NAD(P)-dependent dehydrogenase (short-subunit alcohol dehydrogenase family)